MICVYATDATDYTGNGEAVLCPISGSVKQVVGGEYSFTMEHPLDPWGKWKELQPERIVKLPIPKETIPAATVGMDTDIYKTNTKAALREEPEEPQTITYQSWPVDSPVVNETKVTYNNKNYLCIYWDPSSRGASVSPDYSEWWKEIPRTTNGAAILATLKTGKKLYLIDDYNSTWYKMMTTYGLEGYIKKSQVTFYRHITTEDLEPRVLTEQLFRIKKVNVDRKSGKVTVSGNHVSYDLNGVMVEKVKLSKVMPAMAIGMITEAFMIDYPGDIATNITDDTFGTYTGEIIRKNGMYCLTDPDKGIVSQFEAQFRRDNWDLFIFSSVSTEVPQPIRMMYGKNTNGILWNRDTSRLITRVVPVAKNEKGEDLYLSGKWVDSEDIDDYPVIYMEELRVEGQVGKDDGTGTNTKWTTSTLREEMETKAEERFSVDMVDKPVIEVTVQLEMLGDTAEYAWAKQMQELALYELEKVEDPEIGLSETMFVTEIEYDCVNEKISGIKLSNTTYKRLGSVAGYSVTNGSLTEGKLSAAAKSSLVSEAVEHVLDMIG